jgi:hypothetical protein
MNFAHLINEPCMILTRSGTPTYDSYGDAVISQGTATGYCEIQPVPRINADREAEMGNLAEDLFSVFLLPTSVVDHLSAVVVGSDTYEFVGVPHIRRNPRTQSDEYIRGYARLTS